MVARTCVVACNLPNGLILSHGKIRRDGAGVPVIDANQRVVMDDIKTVRLYGGRHISAVGGYGLTHNVDADWFDDYMRENAQSKLVLIGGLFAMPTAEFTTGMARERIDFRCGLEPLSERDPRAFEGDPNGVVDRMSDGKLPANTFGSDDRTTA